MNRARLAGMRNKAMARKLQEHQAVDISTAPLTAARDYVLATFEEGQDYCDARNEVWIWSIAKILRPLPSTLSDGSRRILQPGEYLASTSTKFYFGGTPHPALECVFLR